MFIHDLTYLGFPLFLNKPFLTRMSQEHLEGQGLNICVDLYLHIYDISLCSKTDTIKQLIVNTLTNIIFDENKAKLNDGLILKGG